MSLQLVSLFSNNTSPPNCGVCATIEHFANHTFLFDDGMSFVKNMSPVMLYEIHYICMLSNLAPSIIKAVASVACLTALLEHNRLHSNHNEIQ